MQLDVRVPIGVMFALIGAILVVYGLFTWGDAELYQRSLKINVNFWWGGFMALFGVVMLWLAKLGRKA
jgi:hypothetical protein